MASTSYLNRLYTLIQNNRRVVYIPLLIYWVALFVGTSLPAPVVPIVFSYNDKVEHFLAFFILAVLFNLTLHFQKKSKLLSKRSDFFTLLIIPIYGAVDEFHQILIPGRSCEFLDWLADASGVLFGIGLVYLFLKFSLRNRSLEPK